MIMILSGIFAGLLAQSDVEGIKSEWSTRRCDLSVMVTAQLYKPADDVRSGAEFAAENFNFCVKSIFVKTIEMFLTPVYAMIGQQMDVVESVGEMLNKLRAIQASFLRGFNKILDPVFNRFRNTGSQFTVTYQKFLSAMGRAFGITQAILYIGMSLVLAVENFVHFVINVVLIIMYIILGIMIILWFMVLPVFGLIILTCQTIGNSPFGYLSRDVCGELCFDPKTKVRLANGRIKTFEDLQVGDTFEDRTQIEGILRVKGDTEPMFTLDGIRVSGAHLIWFEEGKEWIPVSQHPSATLSLQSCPLLICLRTTTRNIPLQGLTRSWTFRDWEELPVDLECADGLWDSLVQAILNEKKSEMDTPTEYPMLRDSCEVLYKTGEIRRISEVKIGDSVYSSKGFTTVTGIYLGEASFSEGEQYTNGVWLQSLGAKDWIHPNATSKTSEQKEIGFHLTTESGCFWIQTKQFSGFVRDFTEVGTHNLFLTYSYTRKLLKKSFSREESCVSDSLSQVLSSC